MADRKTELIQVRVTPKQAEAIRERAEQDGRPVSSWLRELARREIVSADLQYRQTAQQA